MTPTSKQTMEESDELFELCKQVYEVTGWKDTEQYLWLDDSYHNTHPEWDTIERASHDMGGKGTPLYTSDYLLEKLPVYSEDAEGMLSVTTRQGQERNGWMAYYEDVDGYSVGAEGIGKSPLEALLRLTLKLHEEKIL